MILFLPYKVQGKTWKKRLSQKQVHREESWIRGGLVGASYRWHWCFWYAVYWLWEVSAAWFLWRICGWCEIECLFLRNRTKTFYDYEQSHCYLSCILLRDVYWNWLTVLNIKTKVVYTLVLLGLNRLSKWLLILYRFTLFLVFLKLLPLLNHIPI